MAFDYLVFIGRFQPFHNGHAAVARAGLARAGKLIVLVGSADTPRTIRNPWSVSERAVMITSALPDADGRLLVRALHDQLYHENLWVAGVQRAVAQALADDAAAPGARVGIIGMEKDASSYYLRAFPQWPLVDVMHAETLSATDLRRYFFAAGPPQGKSAPWGGSEPQASVGAPPAAGPPQGKGAPWGGSEPQASVGAFPAAGPPQGNDVEGGLRLLRANVPEPVWGMLDAFRQQSPAYTVLVDEFAFIERYRAAWAAAPYPPTFVTADAVVVHSGHVLLVRRRAAPGKGLWALPGGFVGQDETVLDACLRELREETRLKLPVPVLKGSIRGERVFDHPDRSLRGRTITHAFHFDFPSGALPAVRSGDDADKTRWVPVSEALAMSPQLFEDHWHILAFFLGGH